MAMDDDTDIDFEDAEGPEPEFLEFVTRLYERNRTRQVRELIERKEESRRMGEMLGLEGLELGHDY